jgi:hypothetical protein
MQIITLQSAAGEMSLSTIDMIFAATGHLSPVSGSTNQEISAVLILLHVLRAAFSAKSDSSSLTIHSEQERVGFYPMADLRAFKHNSSGRGIQVTCVT